MPSVTSFLYTIIIVHLSIYEPINYYTNIFGAILIESENTTQSDRDDIVHAEIKLIRQESKKYQYDFLVKCTLYASTEPCLMCPGAIYWSQIRRVVYGLSEEGLFEMAGNKIEDVFLLPCRDVFAKGHKKIEVVGPILEEEEFMRVFGVNKSKF